MPLEDTINICAVDVCVENYIMLAKRICYLGNLDTNVQAILHNLFNRPSATKLTK